MKVIAEYLWLDGKNLIEDKDGKLILDANRNQDARSKTKILTVPEGTKLEDLTPERLSVWGFDGSSTNQARGHNSDCVLKPISVYLDPIRNKRRPDYLSILVLNEVFDRPGDKPHLSNMRAKLKELAEKYSREEFWFGLEQEYTLLRADTRRPLGFPETGFPEAQGKYYCGVGADRIVGRKMVEEHMYANLDAKLLIAGVNAEVMPGQWEYQMGNGTAFSDPLKVADDLIVSRYLMQLIGEDHGVIASLNPKPQEGDWNGAGMHVNFSTKAMREDDKTFAEIIEKLRRKHPEHISVYGEDIEKRLTGKHETCPYTEFKAGISDRGASIRIPWQVAAERKGYLEDRRPCANINPYVVLAKIIETVMEG